MSWPWLLLPPPRQFCFLPGYCQLGKHALVHTNSGTSYVWYEHLLVGSLSKEERESSQEAAAEQSDKMSPLGVGQFPLPYSLFHRELCLCHRAHCITAGVGRCLSLHECFTVTGAAFSPIDSGARAGSLSTLCVWLFCSWVLLPLNTAKLPGCPGSNFLEKSKLCACLFL